MRKIWLLIFLKGQDILSEGAIFILVPGATETPVQGCIR